MTIEDQLSIEYEIHVLKDFFKERLFSIPEIPFK